MSSTKTVYLNLRQLTQVHQSDVFVKDVADVYCSDRNIQNKCRTVKIKAIHDKRENRYIENALDVIQKLEALDSSIQVNNVGKVEFIIDYKPQKTPGKLWEWIKTAFVCIVCFCGAAFAIMTFNNDVSVSDVFQKIYFLVTGMQSDGYTALEASYSIGLAVGILLFFNHFTKWKFSNDPTPLEVEMRLYEENISKTLIQNSERKEKEVDVR